MSVSLRVPDRIKKRISRLAQAQATTPHAFMLEAIEQRLDADEANAAFVAEGAARLAKMKKTGKAVPSDEVFDYFARRAAGKPAKRPVARKLG